MRKMYFVFPALFTSGFSKARMLYSSPRRGLDAPPHMRKARKSLQKFNPRVCANLMDPSSQPRCRIVGTQHVSAGSITRSLPFWNEVSAALPPDRIWAVDGGQGLAPPPSPLGLVNVCMYACTHACIVHQCNVCMMHACLSVCVYVCM